jgi:hypothetical protein
MCKNCSPTGLESFKRSQARKRNTELHTNKFLYIFILKYTFRVFANVFNGDGKLNSRMCEGWK